jgi:hypothetical protein
VLLISRGFLSQVPYRVEFTNTPNHDTAGRGVKKLQIDRQLRLFGSLFLIFSCQDECTEFGLVGGLIKALTTGIDEVVYMLITLLFINI